MTATQNPPPKESMGVDPFEKNWMVFSITLLVLFAAAVTVAGFALGYQVPGVEFRVDPATVLSDSTSPFATPGVRQISDDQFEAYVVARQFLYDPNTITLPVGATVDIYVTSPDVQHGFKITDTNINMQVVPGQVSKLSFTFDREGEYPIICHEYCGLGHAAMFGTVRIVPAADFEGGTS